MGSPSGLREPQRWNDRNLLEDVPFKDIFQTRSLVFEQRGRNAALNWDKEVMEAVEKTPGWVRIPPFISVVKYFYLNYVLAGGYTGVARHSVLCEQRGALRDSNYENQGGYTYSRTFRESLLGNFPK